MIINVDVPGKLGIVGEDGVIPDLAIVREMHISHHPVVVAETGDAGVLHGTEIERAEFADRIAIADFKPRGLPRILLVLRCCTDRRKLKDAVVAADLGVPADDRMRADRGTRTDFDMCADDSIRTDLDVGCKLCAGFNNCGWMNF